MNNCPEHSLCSSSCPEREKDNWIPVITPSDTSQSMNDWKAGNQTVDFGSILSYIDNKKLEKYIKQRENQSHTLALQEAMEVVKAIEPSSHGYNIALEHVLSALQKLSALTPNE